MKRYRFMTMIFLAAMFACAACSSGGGGGGEDPVEINFISAVQSGGSSGTADSTAIELTFDADPSTLTVDDIFVLGATKVALTGNGTTRSLSITNLSVINGAMVYIDIDDPSGYAISGSPVMVAIYRAPQSVTFQGAVQTGGSQSTVDSTGLTLTFSSDPTTLTADNITVTGATKGALTGSGTTRNLAISGITVDDGATVSVAITSPYGYSMSGSPVMVAIYRAVSISVTFQAAVQIGGSPCLTDSTSLTLTFSSDPTTLSADNITVTGATKGALSGSGNTRSLAISDITVASGRTVSVAITSPVGYSMSGSPLTAVVYSKGFVVGAVYGGGIIAYIFQEGDPGYVDGEVHGIIAATANLGTMRWHNGTSLTTGATGTAMGTGSANTTAIISTQGNTGTYAAKACRDYTGGDYSDWSLPSVNEMAKLAANKDVIGITVVKYWTSTEVDQTNATAFSVGYGSWSCAKSDGISNDVRPIRYF